MDHDHQILTPSTFVAERACGYLPYHVIAGHTPDDIHRDVCGREASAVASRAFDDGTMHTAYLCAEHERLVRDCSGCQEKNIEIAALESA